MKIPIRMPDERLAPFIDTYGHWPMPMEDISTFAPGLIAFNLSGARLEIDGRPRTESVLMGIATEPTHIRYTIGEGDIVSLRCRSSAYDRLFDIDPSEQAGIVAMDPQTHPRLATLHERLMAAEPNVEAWFAALDQALLDLVPQAKPAGLVGRMVETVNRSERDWTVGELAEELGCSIRTLERACLKRFGRTPKRLLRGQRLYRTLSMEANVNERVELMPDFAYSDLPHYLNDIRRISGHSRKELKDDARFGFDFPYIYLWPDGSAAETDKQVEAWREEMDRRIQVMPG